VDIETRRKKRQGLLLQALERKVRSRAKELYETRGRNEGQDLENWFQAESEVLENSSVAPLYRRLRGTSSNADSIEQEENSERLQDEHSACETGV
jgi:hypothetical protein